MSGSGFFYDELKIMDAEIFSAIQEEYSRRHRHIDLIASENMVSYAVLQAQGSLMGSKYAEGYPRRRYYGGCDYVDIAEELAIKRAKELFGCQFANVQPSSGSQMNQAVFLALLNPGDSFMGLDLSAGGHLTHGSSVNLSGKWFHAIPYGVRKDDGLLDMQEIEKLAHQHKPKLILAGATAYSRIWDWKKFREIADSVGAFLMVDMAHIAGLVAGGVHPSPLPHAHVVTTTTSKSLRGPRGGIILTNDEAIAKKVDSAVFPGLQGGPLMNMIAAKAVSFKEALSPSFKTYAANVVANAKALAATLQNGGLHIVSGGTDNHLMLVDLRSARITGKQAEAALSRVNIICNKNSIPFDPEKPFVTSGVRFGSPVGTTRGFGENEYKEIGNIVLETIDYASKTTDTENTDSEIDSGIRNKVADLTDRFPVIYRENFSNV